MKRAVRLAGCGLLAAAVLAGCKKKDGDEVSGSNAGVTVDTSDNTPMTGMSDEELKKQAQALTPEQAAAQGVAVDTTIHIENLGSQDSTPAGAANNDTAAKSTTAAPAAKP